jgi:uncharacterized protein (TIGR03032 family)
MTARRSASKAAVHEALWAHHHAELRDPHQIVTQWRHAADVDPALFECRVTGDWWGVLDHLGVTLLVTREYEHLVLAFCVSEGKKRTSYLHLPHPNGLAVEPQSGRVHIASTRNPNVIFDFAPCAGAAPGRAGAEEAAGQLLPVQSRYLPGCLYLHDLALIGGELYANAVGLNVVVRLPREGGFEPVWWPHCIDTEHGPRTDRNYLQLNSIAPGASLAESYFGASAATPSRRRPGHLNFPVDRRGVIFSGKTREVCGVGLTRPHSARLRGGEVWVDNSGYGELGRIADGVFEPVVRLPGWTRGLYFHGDWAFVGTSRVLPKYAHYAPGLVPDECRSGVHAIELSTGRVRGSVYWPAGNQLFAIEAVERRAAIGFPFLPPRAGRPARAPLRCFSEGVAA